MTAVFLLQEIIVHLLSKNFYLFSMALFFLVNQQILIFYNATTYIYQAV